MGKTTNKNPLAKSLKAYHCFMFIWKRGYSQFWYQKKKRLSQKLFNSKFSHWQRREKREVSQPVGTLAENAPKDLAGDKGARVVLVSTLYKGFGKVNSKLNKQINKQRTQALPFLLNYLQWLIHLRAAPFKLLPVPAASFKGRALSGGWGRAVRTPRF